LISLRDFSTLKKGRVVSCVPTVKFCRHPRAGEVTDNRVKNMKKVQPVPIVGDAKPHLSCVVVSVGYGKELAMTIAQNRPPIR